MSAGPAKIALGRRLLVMRDQGMTGQAIADREGLPLSQAWAAINAARDARAAEVREQEAAEVVETVREVSETPWWRLTEREKRALHKIRDEIRAADLEAMRYERRR